MHLGKLGELCDTPLDVAPIMRALQEYFEMCGTDRDGRIGFGGFVRLLQYLGVGSELRDRRTDFQNIDLDRRQSININEFFAWWMK